MATIALASTHGIAVSPISGMDEATAKVILSYTPQDDEKDTFSLIWFYSRKYGVDINLAMKIAECESKFLDVKNPKSSASGPFQMIDGTFKYVKKLSGLSLKRGNLKDEVESAMWLLKDGNTKPWDESKPCWSKL